MFGGVGGGRKMGRLVLKPLKDCSNLTRKDGALTQHATVSYTSHSIM